MVHRHVVVVLVVFVCRDAAKGVTKREEILEARDGRTLGLDVNRLERAGGLVKFRVAKVIELSLKRRVLSVPEVGGKDELESLGIGYHDGTLVELDEFRMILRAQPRSRRFVAT